MDSNKGDYHSYLLRLWRVRDNGENWRASLEHVQSGELQGFTRLADLVNFLQSVTGSDPHDQVTSLQSGDHPDS